MKMVKLNRVNRTEILVNVAAIVSIEAIDEESTTVSLTNGTHLIVSDFAVDIVAAIGAEVVTVAD